jgi:hypothetical protein
MSKKSRVLRVELELQSRFLRHYEIKDPFDFHKLAQILPGRHIEFARFNEKKLVARLRGMGFSPKKVWEIVEDVRLLQGDVWATLNYLRQELRMTNTRRLLDPLDTNDLVLDALREWAAMWPTAPGKLRTK